MSALIFMAITARKNHARAARLGLGLLVVPVYAILLAPGLDMPWKTNQYLDLVAIHIPLLCWIALGITILGFKSSTSDRFAFLIKSIEVMITAGLYLIAGMVFGGITVGMFEAIGVSLPKLIHWRFCQGCPAAEKFRFSASIPGKMGEPEKQKSSPKE